MKTVYFRIAVHRAKWAAILLNEIEEEKRTREWYDAAGEFGWEIDGETFYVSKILTGIGWRPDAMRAIRRALKEEVRLDPLPEDWTGQMLAALLETSIGEGE